jgi:microcystin-dependent protein
MIATFGFNFNPSGWQMCNGQTLSISQNAALFALLGTTYGGNGVSTFQLPDLRSRVPIHQGTGSGLSTYVIGEASGSENVTLTYNQIPQHTHSLNAYDVASDSHTPQNAVLSKTLANGTATYSDQTPNTTMSPVAIGVAGGSQPHSNIQPYLVINFCIAMVGIFPSRN